MASINRKENIMGREVRRVPADWQHPKNDDWRDNNKYKPLFLGEDYTVKAQEFLELANFGGLQEAVDYYGQAPDINDYMPNWADGEKTHYMMYETTSEGTPISPAFTTPEELARWLADTGASAFGSTTASYESWLWIACGG